MKKTMYLLGLCTIASGLSTSCQSHRSDNAAKETAPAIDTTAMDKSVSPKADFFRFCNGGWMKANPLKDEYSRYGSFDILSESALEKTHQILQQDLANAASGSDEEKAKTLYDLSMDSTKLNADGAQPILPLLKEIDGIQSKADLVQFLAQQANQGSSYLVMAYVSTDEKNSDAHLLNLVQPSLIMGDKDYYSTNPSFRTQKEEYQKYLAQLFTLVNIPESEASQMAQTCLSTETSLSEILSSKEEMRDAEKNYNKLSTATLYKDFSFPYREYFSQRKGLEEVQELNVSQLDFSKKFDLWFANTPLESLKTLLKAYALDDAAGLLSDNFREASFAFHGKVMSGAKQMRPRWKSAVARVNSHLGEILGKVYVEKYFPATAKKKMLDMVENLKTVLSERINTLEWMSQETKNKAQEKLSTITVKIGYPDKWEDYSKLEAVHTSLYDYIQHIATFETEKNVADLHKPVDRDKWLMNPHTVNAYYNPTTNEICFPAGILQPPFFNMNADDAVNYGAIGVVIGHEITHGFDDQGRHYDKDGNMTNWWTDEDAQRFNQVAEKLAQQYSNITVSEGLKANGHLTLGENIADQGGLLISYQALMKSLEGKPQETLEGWTPAQRFFIAYGRVWGQNIRPEEIIRLTKIDPHSLGEWRVNMALKNIPQFYEAFDIQPNDPMYLAPEDRVLVW